MDASLLWDIIIVKHYTGKELDVTANGGQLVEDTRFVLAENLTFLPSTPTLTICIQSNILLLHAQKVE